jgi:hypothetical protein
VIYVSIATIVDIAMIVLAKEEEVVNFVVIAR